MTSAYGADVQRVIAVLNEALATELVCVLRYKHHHFAASGLQAELVAAEFLDHATEEQHHADRLAARIAQLGGEPDYNPETLLSRSHSEYTTSNDLLELVREDLVAERVAIASYTEIINWLGDGDPTTRRLIESILEVEEERADRGGDVHRPRSGSAPSQRHPRGKPSARRGAEQQNPSAA